MASPFAIVVADSSDNAERAAAVLRVTFAGEKPAGDPTDPEVEPIVAEAAAQPDARTPADTSRGDADRALADAAARGEATHDIARENHNPMAAGVTSPVIGSG